MYNWLKAEFPIQKTKELQRLKRLNKRSECINVSETMAEELAELKFEFMIPNKMSRIDSTFNQSVSRTSMLTIGSPIKQVSTKQSQMNLKMAHKLNQLFNISKHYSDMTN